MCNGNGHLSAKEKLIKGDLQVYEVQYEEEKK